MIPPLFFLTLASSVPLILLLTFFLHPSPSKMFSPNHKEIGTLYFIFAPWGGLLGTLMNIFILLEPTSNPLYSTMVSAYAFFMVLLLVFPFILPSPHILYSYQHIYTSLKSEYHYLRFLLNPSWILLFLYLGLFFLCVISLLCHTMDHLVWVTPKIPWPGAGGDFSSGWNPFNQGPPPEKTPGLKYLVSMMLHNDPFEWRPSHHWPPEKVPASHAAVPLVNPLTQEIVAFIRIPLTNVSTVLNPLWCLGNQDLLPLMTIPTPAFPRPPQLQFLALNGLHLDHMSSFITQDEYLIPTTIDGTKYSLFTMNFKNGIHHISNIVFPGSKASFPTFHTAMPEYLPIVQECDNAFKLYGLDVVCSNPWPRW